MKPSDFPWLEANASAGGLPDAQAWRRASIATLLVLSAALLAYWDSVLSMVSTWARSNTYTHGFIVFPVAVWLMWRERRQLRTITPKIFVPGFAVLFVLSAVWFFGRLAHVQSFQEFALVVSIPIALFAMLGTQFARAFAFPLAFMVFAWPFGEVLIPQLIDWTADFTVTALRITGVPVYRQGNSFAIPTGNWSVVEACSGVRYLLASICGGSLFAYLTYRSWRRRLQFTAICLAVPIVANWLRAYLIVVLGHLTDNRLAAGVDHLVYGWLFFGVIMGALFYYGARWKEAPAAQPQLARPARVETTRTLGTSWVAAAVIAITIIATGPLLTYAIAQRMPTDIKPVHLTDLAPPDAWKAVDHPLTNWQPSFENPSVLLRRNYENDTQQIELIAAYFRNQRAGAKLLTFATTTLADYESEWKPTERQLVSGGSSSSQYRVIEKQIQSKGRGYLVWQWYWVDGLHTTSVWRAKLAEVRAQLAGRSDDATGFVLLTPLGERTEDARQVLDAFLRAMRPALDRTLVDAASRRN